MTLMRTGAWLRIGVAALLALGGLALVLQPSWGGVREQAAQRQLAQAMRVAADAPAQPAAQGSAAAEPAPPPKPGSVYAELTIPSIGLRAMVVDGATLTDYSALMTQGPVHLAGSAEPGALGNAVVFGHRDIYGSPFMHLYRLHPGDAITLTAPGGSVYEYVVQSVSAVAPSDLAPIAPVATRALTLITCTGPFNSQRLIVRAVMEPSLSSPQQTPA